MIHLICKSMCQLQMQYDVYPSPTFCLRQAAHALTFLDIPGNLESAWAPLEELVRCGALGGAFAMRGGSSKELRLFFGERACPGEA